MTNIQIVSIVLIVVLFILLFVFDGINKSINEFSSKDAKENKKNKIAVIIINNEKKALVTVNILETVFSVLITLFFVLFFREFNISLYTVYSVLSSILLITFILFFPKKTAQNNPIKYFNLFGWLLIPFYFLLYPLTTLFMWQKSSLSKALDVTSEDDVSEDDLIDYIEDATEDGVFSKDESELIKNVIEFDDILVKNVLVPRTSLVAASSNNSKDEIRNIFITSGYSRLPYYKESLDNIIGIITYKDFINNCILGDKSIKSIVKEPLNVTEYMKIKDLLAVLQKTKTHIAIVKDEYNGTIGIITLEDILEELVGDIYDEHDKVVELVTKIDDTTYLVKGDAELDVLYEKMELDIDNTDDYQTVNGYILDYCQAMPKENDVISTPNIEFKIMKTSETKILEALASLKNNN
ncbi:MAG: hemolysin family protein [Acholeplasmatales bacterium]|jgi:CBS domain containing-hemolysin-like protein|nr:hemolysin family protein [Acholeplasmatales bacterium]